MLSQRAIRRIMEWIDSWQTDVWPFPVLRDSLIHLKRQRAVVLEAGASRILQQFIHGVLGGWIHQTAVDRDCEVDLHRCNPFSFRQACSISCANVSEAAFFFPWTS